MSSKDQSKPGGELLMYRTTEESKPIRVLLEGENVWLTQRLIADLYDTSVPNISQHITAICRQEELQPKATLKKYLIVQSEGRIDSPPKGFVE